MAVMAQFPLQSVLLPGVPLGLHVFEPRYVRLLDDVAGSGGRFGVVLITHGSEVGGADQRADVGTVAEIVELQPIGDGRWLLEAIGRERFRVLEWLDDDPYPRAEIEEWPHPMSETGGVLERVSERFRTFLTLASELGADVGGIDATVTDVHGLYRMASVVPVSAYDRYRVLAAADGAESAELLIEAVGGVVDLLRFRMQDG